MYSEHRRLRQQKTGEFPVAGNEWVARQIRPPAPINKEGGLTMRLGGSIRNPRSFKAIASVVFAWGLCVGAFGQTPVKLKAPPMTAPEVVGRSMDLGETDPNQILHLAVSLPYAKPDDMAAFVDNVSNPASPNYMKFVTPEDVGAKFGLPDSDVQRVATYLSGSGLTIDLIGKNHLTILAEGTVAQAEQAFGVSIHDFQTLSDNEPGNLHYYSNTTAPQLPPAIAPFVIDVTGLESFTKPQMRELTPTQTRTLYDVAPMYSAGKQGQGRTVAISNWDGFRLSNVPLFYSQYGLPTPPGGVGSNITVITLGGGSGSGDPQSEGDLDIQMVLGMAPLCSLRIYDGVGNDPISVLTAEVNDNLADVITESYGWIVSASTGTAAHNLHLSMSAQGITYMAASGDSGTSLEPYSYPDYEPEVLSVGGTIATVNAAGNRISEVAWSLLNGWGGGGGWSNNSAAFNVRPSWQHGTNVPTTINHRLVPDVALLASGPSNAYAYFMYWNGSLIGNGGTSASSPVFAGSLAVAEQQIISRGGLPPNGAGKQRFGRIQDLIYSQNGRSDVYFDITSGNIGTLPDGTQANAGPAWDFCTGWGAFDFNAFAGTQASPPPAPTGLVATAGNSQVSLTWNASTGATSYNVKRATVSGGPYATVTSQTTTSYTNTGLAGGTTYYFVVTAVNVVGESGNSNEASATPFAATYYPKTTATSQLRNSYPPCQGTGMSCQFLPNESLLPRPTSTNIVMHGGGYTGSCSLTGVQGCTEQEVEVFINDPPLTWPQWCLANNEAYTLGSTTRYDFRGVSVIGCSPNAFNFQYEYLCRSNADCQPGDTCSKVTGLCYPPSIDPVTLEAGYAHSVSAHSDGTVWAWGWNGSGQLGDSTLTSRNGPVRSGTLTGVLEVGAGVFHTIALKSDGTVWTWGDNSQGQLGDGTTTSRSFPGQVPGLTGVVAIASGASHNLAVKSDGTVWTWGDNWGGQIGDGTTTDRLTPFQVPGLSGVKSVSGGFYHSVAVKGDGTVWTWGRNAEGELGNGTHADRFTPGPVPGLTDVSRASCGAYFTMVVLGTGTMKGWGHNYYGELGDGTNVERPTPVAVPGLTSMIRVASGSGFTLALRSDGTVWSWGQNVAGELGDGTTIDRNTPQQIPGLSGIVEIAAGEDHSLARSGAGIVYGWGKNLNGQIGVGPWPRTSPAAVTDETQPAPLSLMAPVGGEIWSPGSSQVVSWTGAGPISVKISYDGGTTYTTLNASTSLQDVPITVPTNWSTARGRVRIDRVGTPASAAQTGAYMRIHPPQTHPWLLTTVDSGAPVVGEFSSVAIDPWGRTGIAYTDRTNGDLKFALHLATGWTIDVVDSVNSTGWYTSLAFGADGTPRISYMDGTRTYLRYAHKTTAGSWITEDVADTSCTLPTSLGFDLSDRPFIAIQDCSMTSVRVWAKSGTAWSQIEYVSGASPSLKMQGNLPRISYFLHTTNPTQLHYLTASGTLGSFTWQDVPVPGGDGANWNSITIDPQGNPRISFYAVNTKSLRMAKLNSGTWTVDVVDSSVGDVGNWNSIALDPSSRPRISYLANGLVKVAEWNGTSWQLDAVDASGDTPAATSIAVDAAGNDRISYFDTPNGDLRYAISQQDTAPPAAPVLQATPGKTTMVVGWTAPGDDGTTGTASAYELRWSQSPITSSNFSQATLVPLGPPSPSGYGECVDFSSLSSCRTYYFGLKVLDDVGNESPLSTTQMTTLCSGNLEVLCN